eukprot:g1518.t1
MPPAPTDVYVVGFGVPGRSMAWFHCEQLRHGLVANARLRGVIEPGLAVPGLSDTAPVLAWQKRELTEKEKNKILVVKSVADLPPLAIGGAGARGGEAVALVACRTTDMCAQLCQLVDHGIRFIYLEKPGAFSAAELEQAKRYADRFGAKVFLGYNRNVAPYLENAVAALQKTEAVNHLRGGKRFVFHCEHFNTYTARDLLELNFARNTEGILKNMAIHELMIAVAFFGYTVEKLKEVRLLKSAYHPFAEADKRAFPALQGLDGDFSFLQFQLVHFDDKVPVFQVTADRCGGDVVRATVLLVDHGDAAGAGGNGKKDGVDVIHQANLNEKEVPADGEVKVEVIAANGGEEKNLWMQKYPDMMPYFYGRGVDIHSDKEAVAEEANKSVCEE